MSYKIQTLDSINPASQFMNGAIFTPSSFALAGKPLKSNLTNNNSISMDPIIGGALISAGSGIISSIFGNKSSKRALQSQRETNEMNYKIWQEQKQHNLDMYNLQNEDAIDFWNMQNDYNTPLAQRQRLEEAGYNPYALLNGGSSEAGAISQASMQGTTPPTMQTPSDIAFQDPIQTGINSALATFQQATNAMFTNQRVGNETNLTNSDLILKNLDAVDKKYRNKYVDMMYKYQVDSMKQEFDQKRELFPMLKEQAIIGNSLANAQLAGTLLDNDAKEIENQWLPKEKAKEYDIKCAMWANQVRIGLKTEQEVKNLIAQEILTYVNVSNGKKQGQILDEQVEQSKITTQEMSQDWKINKLDDWKIKQYSEKKYDAMFTSMEMMYYQNLNGRERQKNIWKDRLINPSIWHFKDTSVFAPGNADFDDYGGVAVELGRRLITKGK